MSNTFLDPVTGLATERVQLTGSKVAEGIADFVLNTQGTLFASAARTATLNSANQTNYNARGLYAILNVTAAPVTPGAGGLALSIVGIDPISGNIFAINPAATAITTTGFFAYEIYPGASGTVAGTGSFSTVQRTAASIPRNWLARMNHNDAQPYTYSLSYLLTL